MNYFHLPCPNTFCSDLVLVVDTLQRICIYPVLTHSDLAFFVLFCVVLSLCREAVRRDWHQKLATINDINNRVLFATTTTPSSSPSPSPNPSVWQTTTSYWRGYIQREGSLTTSSSSASTNTVASSSTTSSTTSSSGSGSGSSGSGSGSGSGKPLAFVLHGFGGSLDQMTALAQVTGLL